MPTVKELKKEARDLKIKGRSSLNKAGLIKEIKKAKELLGLDGIFFTEIIKDIDVKLLIKLNWDDGKVSFYNIITLQRHIANNNNRDPATTKLFPQSFIKKAKKLWYKLRHEDKKNNTNFLLTKSNELFNENLEKLPKWGFINRIKPPEYQLLISLTTPYLYTNALHIIENVKFDSNKYKTLEKIKKLNGINNTRRIWRKILNLSKWTILLPTGPELETNTRYYDNDDDFYDYKIIASGSSGAAVFQQLKTVWDSNKLLTHYKFENTCRRSSILGNNWILNLPILLKNLSDLSQKNNLIYDKKYIEEVLLNGGILFPYSFWKSIKGRNLNHLPNPIFYKVWNCFVEQISYLKNNETPQY
jgi:hypothetical protein